MPRSLAGRGRASRLQPRRATGERLLFPVQLDLARNLRPASQSARAPLLRQSSQGLARIFSSTSGGTSARDMELRGNNMPIRCFLGHRSQGAYRRLSPCRATVQYCGALLIQHGSYQWIHCQDQPYIERGEVLLYRGIGQVLFSVACNSGPKSSPLRTARSGEDTWACRRPCCRTRSCRSTPFTIASIAARPEACATQRGWATRWRRTAGLDINSPGFAKKLWHAAQQSYSLDPVMGTAEVRSPLRRAENPARQHPHHDILRGQESEVKIVDPSRISLVDARRVQGEIHRCQRSDQCLMHTRRFAC